MREAIFPDEKTTCRLLQAWQAGGGPDDFHQLWKGIKSMVESTVRKTLCRQGIRDPSAADEAISLVMGHLLRLPSGGVAKFDGNQSATGYLFWLSSRRCRDVTRSLRRRREVSLSEVERRIAEPLVESHFDCGEDRHGGMINSLHDAMKALDERSQLVIERYLASEPQIITAKFLGISEGTVTRVRQRAIEKLRKLLPEVATNPRPSKPR
jgi:RNA polymerase sigma factor (sigma-70 family)